MLLYPFAAYQMDHYMDNPPYPPLYDTQNVDGYGNGKGVAYENKGIDDVPLHKIDTAF